MKKILSNILASLFSLLILFVVLEISVRLFVDESLYIFSNVSDDWILDEEIGYKNKPDYSEVKRHKDKMVELHTNVDGLQPAGLKREKKEGVTRVMLVGNSTVFARDVPEEEKIHYYLDSMLNASGEKYEVINTGVTGYSTDQSLLTLKRYIKLYDPDYVGYNYCVNDLYYNTSGFFSRISKPHYEMQNGEWVFVPGEPEKSVLDQNIWQPQNMIQLSALYGLLRPYIQRVRMKMSKQTELDQGGESVFAMYKKSNEEEPLFVLLEKLMVEMKNTCDENGVRFFVYTHPELRAVWPPYRKAIGQEDVDPFSVENKLLEIAGRNDFPFVGMVQHFMDNQEKGPFHILPNDPHCNGVGYYLQAEVLTGFVRSNEMRPDVDSITLK